MTEQMFEKKKAKKKEKKFQKKSCDYIFILVQKRVKEDIEQKKTRVVKKEISNEIGGKKLNRKRIGEREGAAQIIEVKKK